MGGLGTGLRLEPQQARGWGPRDNLDPPVEFGGQIKGFLKVLGSIEVLQKKTGSNSLLSGNLKILSSFELIFGGFKPRPSSYGHFFC